MPPLEDCSAFYTSPPVHEPPREPPKPAAASSAPSRHRTQEDGGFAGMKNGFLNQQRSKKKKIPEEDIPFIKPSAPSEMSSNLRFPEVQEAMKSPLLNSHGLTKLLCNNCCVLLRQYCRLGHRWFVAEDRSQSKTGKTVCRPKDGRSTA